MKFEHRLHLNYAGRPWIRTWTLAGRSWCMGVSVLVERGVKAKLAKCLSGENGSRILWLWRLGLGLRLARWALPPRNSKHYL